MSERPREPAPAEAQLVAEETPPSAWTLEDDELLLLEELDELDLDTAPDDEQIGELA